MSSREIPGQTPPVEERLAGRLAAGTPPRGAPARMAAVSALKELGQLDVMIYRTIAETPTPTLDRPMRRLSDAADRSKLWLGIAAAMAAAGGRTGRRAAATGLVAVGLDSALVNIGFKFAARRKRPDRDAAGVPADRRVPMPHSASFPPGTPRPPSRSPPRWPRASPLQPRRCWCSPARSATPASTPEFTTRATSSSAR
jgi:hypothetical protein